MSLDTKGNCVRAFSKSVFFHEIEDSLAIGESVIAITDDEGDPERVLEKAKTFFHNPLLLTTRSLRKKLCSEKQMEFVYPFYMRLKQSPDPPCLILDDLWMISDPVIGTFIEQIIMLLPNSTVFVLIAKRFSAISAFYQWFCQLRGMHSKIVEAPLERCPLNYHAISDEQYDHSLVRSSALPPDSYTIREILDISSNEMPTKDKIDKLIVQLLEANNGPILVVVPSVLYFDPSYSCLHSKSDKLREEIMKFESNENGVLFVTVKLAEAVFIRAHSMILFSFLKFDSVTIRPLLPFELCHLVRSVGRVGLDSLGLVFIGFTPNLEISNIIAALSTDCPTLIARFRMDLVAFLTCRLFGMSKEEVEEFSNLSLNGFYQSQLVPLVKDQVIAMTAMLPSEEGAEICRQLSSLEIAISTLCTHSNNIRKLLVNGRFVRVRPGIGERQWAICFGPSLCGTVTVAMKGFNNRGVDSDDRCLATLPITEILAVSSTVMCLQRRMLQDFERNFVMDNEYPLYKGPGLTVGNDRLQFLHAKWEEVFSKASPLVQEHWREFADRIYKHRYLKEKAASLTQDLGDSKKFWSLGLNETDSQVLGFFRGLGCSISFRVMVEGMFLERWHFVEIVCCLAGWMANGTLDEVQCEVCETIENLWREMQKIGVMERDCRCFMERVRSWLTKESGKGTEDWRIGCSVKGVCKFMKRIEVSSRGIGWENLANQMKACRSFVFESPNYSTCFL
jgi:hypothetical protein